MRSRNDPWLWALSLHNLSGSFKDSDQNKETVKIVIDKLLAHPSPGAESLYWAALICVNATNYEDVCRVPALVKRLMESDGDNIYSFAIYFDAELADRTGLHKVSDELLDWSYFDSWLERAVNLNRAESYNSFHFAEFAEILENYAQTEGVPSALRGAPLEWKVAFYITDKLVYPWYEGTGAVTWHCHMSLYFGRNKTTEACRALAKKLLSKSNSILSRSDALFMLSQTYSKQEREFLRFKRESAAWREPVRACLNQIWKFENEQWSVSYDAHSFAEDYESHGEIVALQGLAESAGWRYQDMAGSNFQCTEALEMDDEGLIQFLGRRDPAWMWCETDDPCDLPLSNQP